MDTQHRLQIAYRSIVTECDTPQEARMSEQEPFSKPVAKTNSSKPAWYRRTGFQIIGTALFLVLACAAVVVGFTIHNQLDVPHVARPQQVQWLPQNWTDEQRHTYYHTAQGSYLIPYAWFTALEQPEFTLKLSGTKLFRDDSYMEGFGFIPDMKSPVNPDALPVGFTRDDRFVDSYTGRKSIVLGITCAACHTGEIFYGGKAIRIDAGPSMIDLQKFTEAMGLAITWTYYDPLRFRRFADRVLGPDHASADSDRLREDMQYYLNTSLAEFRSTRHLFPTPEGYGRTDALARIGNFVFGTELNNNKNLTVGDGPVNYPPVWDASLDGLGAIQRLDSTTNG